VGKVLTPALLGGLLLLIAVGVFRPIGPIADTAKIENVPASGIMSGYQTMDVLAALIFGTIILKSAENKGYTDTKRKNRVVLGAGIVASLGLLVVYLGLTYLGATVSTLYDGSVNRSALVLAIVESLLGQTGKIVFAVVVALACITTAVALVSSAADYFHGLTGGRVSYKALVVFMCVFSAVVSNVGLDQIVSIAAPILSIVYPPGAGADNPELFQRPYQQPVGVPLRCGGRTCDKPAGDCGVPGRAHGMAERAAAVGSGLRMGRPGRAGRSAGRRHRPRRQGCRRGARGGLRRYKHTRLHCADGCVFYSGTAARRFQGENSVFPRPPPVWTKDVGGGVPDAPVSP
jgi:hypothetical protein